VNLSNPEAFGNGQKTYKKSIKKVKFWKKGAIWRFENDEKYIENV
jgi:hypothetical protein